MTSTTVDDAPKLSVVEAARFLGISAKTLRVLMAAGRITYLRPSPRRIVFDATDLRRYLARRRVTA